MKKLLLLLIILFSAMFLCFMPKRAEAGSNVLVAYFSMSGEQYAVGEVSEGNTAKLAKIVAKKTGGDLYEIRPVKAYPKTYNELARVAKQEKEKNVRPKIAGSVPNFANYDIVYLGFPIWHGDMPMLVYTFLETNDFRGKTIVPFCTHEGSGIAGISTWIKASTQAKKVYRGFDVRGFIAQNDPAEAEQAVIEGIRAIK